MGSYNSQYENYYSTLVNKKKNYGGYSYGRNKSSTFKLDGNYFLKRFMRELIGVFILFIFVIGCKLIVTPQTAAAYKYSKDVLNKKFDYASAVSSVKTLDFKSVEEKSLDFMDSIKSKLTGGKTLKEKLQDSFMLPVEGAVINTEAVGGKNNEGINISVKEGTAVLSTFEGKVKDVGEDSKLGKYIIIDHGLGIETKYAYLNEVSVKIEDNVKKGQVIGKSGKTLESHTPNLHFELMYMGESKNPKDYMSFAKK
ncbi:M23 family metallopeptidase [Clostridium swellfunianum]|uniref:M23 family metallopeptidase n=1 Tax=Clostridium swellfunianum TaxID=1367462 RepID=UPI00202F1383|nr:M23 family metallopeptidase [Clostridium swellfunianum]MCM0648954.1 M23 family metallopeptidase [Clostridium swellfunianum]